MKTILQYKQELETALKANAQGYPVLIADGYNVSNNLTAKTIATYLATQDSVSAFVRRFNYRISRKRETEVLQSSQ